MSIPVDLTELPAHISRLGSGALLVTNSSDGPPHVSSVLVTVERDNLAMRVGHKSRANAATSPAVSLVWPEVDGEHCLIVDGLAHAESSDLFRIRPTSAVLHRLASS